MQNLHIGSASFPCRVTMGAMVRFKQATGRDVSKISDSDITDLVTFMWCCVASASKADGIEFQLSFEDFADQLLPADLADFVTGLASEQKKIACRKQK